MRRCSWTGVVAVSVGLASTIAAQAPNAPAPRLVKAKSVDCTFSQLATGTWTDGGAQATTGPAQLTIGFTNVDTQDGTAVAVGDSGKSHITVRVVGNYLNLMQIDPYGAVYLTTVFNTESKNDRLRAVHTRHEYLTVQVRGLTSRPEQYYGDCAVK
jgi:hypothetical protein